MDKVVCPKCQKENASVFELASHLWIEHQDLPVSTTSGPRQYAMCMKCWPPENEEQGNG